MSVQAKTALKVGVVVQARTGSSRLPGKVLANVCGKTLLERQLRRLQRCRSVDKIVVATSTKTADDSIVKLSTEVGVEGFRGSEDHVLSRFVFAARAYEFDVVVRTNADCPFIDPIVVDRLVGKFLACYPDYDYVSNILEETYPLGMHVEVFTKGAIEKAFSESKLPDEHEHVTAYIYRHEEKFNLLNVVCEENLSKYRWTVDYPEDLQFVRKVYERFHGYEDSFGMWDLVALLRANPELQKINCAHKKRQNIL